MNEDAGPTPFPVRVLRAALLDADLYEEVEADRTAMAQAATVVFLASISIGLGSLWNGGLMSMIWTTGVMAVSWVLWAWVSCAIGVGWFATPETESDTGELLRTIGFSAAPGLFGAVGLLPGSQPWVFVLVAVWMVAALVVAIRQALDYCSTERAIIVCLLSSPVAGIPLLGVFVMTGARSI